MSRARNVVFDLLTAGRRCAHCEFDALRDDRPARKRRPSQAGKFVFLKEILDTAVEGVSENKGDAAVDLVLGRLVLDLLQGRYRESGKFSQFCQGQAISFTALLYGVQRYPIVVRNLTLL